MADSEPSKIKRLAQQIRKQPDDSFSKFALALEFRKQGELKKARILFEDILENDPEYVGIYYHLGKLYELLERPKDALKLYKTGISITEKQNESRTQSELKEAVAQLEIELEE